MLPERKAITSTKNPIVQQFRDAAAGALEGVLLAEGARLVNEALDAGLQVVAAAVSARCDDTALRDRLQQATANCFEVAPDVMARMSALETPPGVAVLLRQPATGEADLLRRESVPLVVVAAGVRDPGNLGSLLRAAEAAGASGCITMRGGADPFRDKAVRGSMGSVFRLPVLHGLDATNVIDFSRRHRLQLVIADGGGDRLYSEIDFRRPTLLVVGAEAAGVPPDLLQAASVRASIPLREPVESLNVAVAAGVLLFEAQRQRRS